MCSHVLLFLYGYFEMLSSMPCSSRLPATFPCSPEVAIPGLPRLFALRLAYGSDIIYFFGNEREWEPAEAHVGRLCNDFS